MLELTPHAGPEIGGSFNKSFFTNSNYSLLLIALKLGREKGVFSKRPNYMSF